MHHRWHHLKHRAHDFLADNGAAVAVAPVAGMEVDVHQNHWTVADDFAPNNFVDSCHHDSDDWDCVVHDADYDDGADDDDFDYDSCAAGGGANDDLDAVDDDENVAAAAVVGMALV